MKSLYCVLRERPDSEPVVVSTVTDDVLHTCNVALSMTETSGGVHFVAEIVARYSTKVAVEHVPGKI